MAPVVFCLARCCQHLKTGSIVSQAAIAQLGERQTEDLKVPGSIPGGGKILIFYFLVVPQ